MAKKIETMKKIWVMRKIWVDEVEDLDLQNLGCHWTTNFNYTHMGGGSNGLTEKKALLCRVTAQVSQKEINAVATAMSNENHPHEKEVVLNTGSKIKIEYDFVIYETGKILGGFGTKYAAEANTGTRVDTWVKNLK